MFSVYAEILLISVFLTNIMILPLLFLFFHLSHCGSNSEISDLKDPVLFCDGCFAMVSELEKDMASNRGQKLSKRIESSLEAVCSTDRLRAYKFSPPTQV